ncbi:hypothetical protein Pmgp_01275 [Pelotomaculum propionicicum]|uniref:Uncharacterized protein n=1 Tax=Pelotomaculum propionicicum TaxID=258475 RepID=A0A4Y7RSD0_9FIRM|nr:hypothetical protein Pmgp_01275 [Pelotomaculum propionicicum]
MVLKQAAPLRSVASELSEAEVAKLDSRDRGQGTHLCLGHYLEAEVCPQRISRKPKLSQDGELKAVQFRPKRAGSSLDAEQRSQAGFNTMDGFVNNLNWYALLSACDAGAAGRLVIAQNLCSVYNYL